MKTKFTDTKLAKFFTEKHPDLIKNIAGAVDFADEFVPPLKIVTAALKMTGLTDGQKTEILDKVGEYANTEYKDYLADVQNARAMYKDSHTMADEIARRVINWNLVIILFLVLLQVAAVYYIESTIAAVVTGVIGTITGALINERSTVVNFFFGSSKGSRDNADVVRKMAQSE
jgi:hypothetical protein